MQILHISADFPDPFNAQKTRAISNLLALIPEHDNQVYSINRVSGLGGISALSFGPAHRAVAYAAPPHGLLLATRLSALARWIITDLTARNLTPRLVHAHKLSVEGLVGAEIAAHLDIPLVVSSQGNSDLRILGMRPDLRRRWRRIWHGAAAVLPFAPWTFDGLTKLLGTRHGALDCLPCPTPADQILVPRMTPPRILSVFGLDDQTNKNAARLIEAVRLVRSRGHAVELDIVGAGSAASFASLSGLTVDQPGIRLLGPIRNDRLQSLMNRAAVLAVPSRRESFGMVFAEALLAGCPVLHGQANGIAGYFDRKPWAVAAPPGGADALAHTLKVMLQAQQPIKAALASAQRAGELDLLRRPAIAARYRRALAHACAVAVTDEPRPEQAA